MIYLRIQPLKEACYVVDQLRESRARIQDEMGLEIEGGQSFAEIIGEVRLCTMLNNPLNRDDDVLVSSRTNHRARTWNRIYVSERIMQ